MDLKRTISAGVLAAGLGVAGLAGLGMGAAAADPGQPCGGPNQQNCQQQGQGHDQQGQGQDNRGQGQNNRDPGQNPQWGPNDVHNRNIDQGRQDHQPFTYWGQQVNPVWDQGHNGWGFWFLNNWIPL